MTSKDNSLPASSYKLRRPGTNRYRGIDVDKTVYSETVVKRESVDEKELDGEYLPPSRTRGSSKRAKLADSPALVPTVEKDNTVLKPKTSPAESFSTVPPQPPPSQFTAVRRYDPPPRSNLNEQKQVQGDIVAGPAPPAQPSAMDIDSLSSQTLKKMQVQRAKQELQTLNPQFRYVYELDNGGKKIWYRVFGTSRNREERIRIATPQLPKDVLLYYEWIMMPLAQRRANDEDVFENYLNRKLN